MAFFVYIVTCSANGKHYVGQTKHPRRRWTEHKSYSRRGRRSSVLYDAIRAYGEDRFSFDVIEVCETEADCDAAEVYWIEWYNSKVPHGYNLCDGGGGLRNPTAETRRKIGEASRGRVFSAETREMWSRNRKGRVVSQEWRDAIRAAKKGKRTTVLSEESMAKLSESVRASWIQRRARAAS